MDKEALLDEIHRLHVAIGECADALERGEEFRESAAGRLRAVVTASRTRIGMGLINSLFTDYAERVSAAYAKLGRDVSEAVSSR